MNRSVKEREFKMVTKLIAEPCTACGHIPNLFKRQLYGTLVKKLALLYGMDKQYPGTYHHIKHFTVSSFKFNWTAGDFAKLRYWGLIESNMPYKKKPRSGMWRITQKGKDFIDGKIEIPRYAYLSDGALKEFSQETVGVRKALGKKFSYDEIFV